MTEKKTQAAIGEALRLLRGDRSTAEVAEAIGISEPSLLAYEGDERAPGDGVKARIAKFYGTPVETIFKVNDEEVNSVSDLRAKVASYKVGDTVKVTYDRNGASRTADVVLEEMPQDNR